jgi:basic membrane protein A
LAPYHNWDGKVPADVKAKMTDLIQKLQSGALQTGVTRVKE